MVARIFIAALSSVHIFYSLYLIFFRVFGFCFELLLSVCLLTFKVHSIKCFDCYFADHSFQYVYHSSAYCDQMLFNFCRDWIWKNGKVDFCFIDSLDLI